MGGHGGLNILPQKRWNVYNFDNREKVRRDEEAAAREEQVKQEEARRRDAQFRLEKLRQATRAKRGFESHDPSQLPHPTLHESAVPSEPQTLSPQKKESEEKEDRRISDSKHINLFDGWNGFQREAIDAKDSDRKEKWKKIRDGDDEEGQKKRRKKNKEEESVRAVLPEDEKYQLGYGLVGKDVKKPWYLSKNAVVQNEEDERGNKSKESLRTNYEKTEKKKSLEELREERLKREQKERERTQKLLFPNSGDSRVKADGFIQKRRPYYNSGFGNAR